MFSRISYRALIVLPLALYACGESTDANLQPLEDSGAPIIVTPDAGSDAGAAAVPPRDAAVVAPFDATVPVAMDAGVVVDAGALGADTGAPLDDAGPGPSGKVPSKLPSATGTCPEFASGDAMFAPMGATARRVRLWVGAKGGGPLIFYWHGTGGSPMEVSSGLRGVLDQITGQGGVVAALYTGANEGQFPWLQTSAEALTIADEVLACAITKKQIDPGRVHALGMSAGGLMTSIMSQRRSNYIASVAPYSGGLQGAFMTQDPANKFAALIFHGGTGDDVFGLNFKMASESYNTALRRNGNFTVICDHGGGHRIPTQGPAAAWRFFQDHPYGTNPSPYVGKSLPSELPSFCMAAP